MTEELEKLFESYLGLYTKVEQAQLPEENKAGLRALVDAYLGGSVLEKTLNNMVYAAAIRTMQEGMQGHQAQRVSPARYGGLERKTQGLPARERRYIPSVPKEEFSYN